MWELIKYIKDLLIYKSAGKLDLYSQDELAKIDELSKKAEKQRLINLVYELSNLEMEMKKSTQKIIMFQAGIINLCNQEQQVNGNLEGRIEKIEKYLRSGNISIASASQQRPQAMPTSAAPTRIQTTQPSGIKANSGAKAVNAQKKYPKDSAKYWPQIVNDLKTSGKIVLYTNLINTNAVELNDMTVGINFPRGLTSFGKTVLEKQENKREIANLVSMACGKPMEIKYISNDNVNQVLTNDDKIQEFANSNNIDFEIIE